MAAAKPGIQPNKVSLKKSQPPAMPDGLTDVQQTVWRELIDNPLISQQDAGLLFYFMRALKAHEDAQAILDAEGLIVTGDHKDLKPHPAYRIVRETGATMLALRQALMATPAARLKVAQSTTVADDDTEQLEID